MIRFHTIRDYFLAWRFYFYHGKLIKVEKGGRVVRAYDSRLFLYIELGLFRSTRLGLRLDTGSYGSDHTPMLSLHIPFLFYIYLGLPFIPFRRGKSDRTTGFYVEWQGDDLVCRVDPWVADEWSRDLPWWRKGCSFYLFDFLFGRHQFSSETLFADDLPLPFPDTEPDGVVPAAVEITVDTWKRKRWPWWPFSRRILRSHITPETPLPLVYKDDSLHSATRPVDGVCIDLARAQPYVVAQEAVRQFIAGVIKDRGRPKK